MIKDTLKPMMKLVFFFDELKQLGTQLEELFETEEVDDDTQEKKEE